jgi:hypothetical protein
MSNQFINLVSLILTCLWNAGILLGAMWLILEKGWSEWTLAATFFFYSSWITVEERLEKQKQEEKRILLDEKLS